MLDLDPEVPPEAEGETGGDEDVVRQIVAASPVVAVAPAIASNPAAGSIAPPWTIVIVPR
jgi:hypothetical protein